MSAQLTYKFDTVKGAAGGIFDLAPYEINTFINSENDGVMKFGVGVVAGATEGTAKLPTDESTIDDFEGVSVNNRTTEYDLVGNLFIRKNNRLGVMRYGRIYVRVSEDATAVAHGGQVFMVTSGDEAGYFTDDDTALAIPAKFVSGVDVNGCAIIDLANPSAIYVTEAD